LIGGTAAGSKDWERTWSSLHQDIVTKIILWKKANNDINNMPLSDDVLCQIMSMAEIVVMFSPEPQLLASIC
jgi:hypothetical protein